MTEYELLDLIGTWKADTSYNATAFTSILFAYILAAYYAGAKMTRLQVTIISILMLWFSLLSMFQITVNQQSIIEYHELIRQEWGVPAVRNGLVMRWVIGVGSLLGVGASLSFMWSVRHPKAE